MKAARRKKFEVDTLPHLEALRRTALWLTMRDRLAKDLVLNTITRAYREGHDSGDPVGAKARLFRTLAREFFGNGKRKAQRYRLGRFLSETNGTLVNTEDTNLQERTPATEFRQLPLLAGASEVFVKGAVARLRPHSRLMMRLLLCERFSHDDIAYIMDLSRNSVRTILTRLRAVILRYILENANYLKEVTDSQSAFPASYTKSDRDGKSAFLHLPFIFPRESPAGSTFDRWENEGGAVIGQCRL